MGFISEDAYGHRTPAGEAGTALSAGEVGKTDRGTIAGTTNAGAEPTVTEVRANDAVGRFTLNPVTGAGAQSAGVTARVRFAESYAAVPRVVLVAVNTGTTIVAAVAAAVTVDGFDLVTDVLEDGASYVVQYKVEP